MRRFFVWLHRWVGLLMSVFLILVGLTGSLLAFNTKFEKLVSPQLFAASPSPQAKPLDLATLAERAETTEPQIRVAYFSVSPEQAFMHVVPRKNPLTGKPYEVDFDQLFLDPWTGRELGHRRWADLSQGRINWMPFIYKVHESLALGDTGAWVLRIVALAWTLDCFVAVYLTLPLVFAKFFSRWKIAWKIKWPSSVIRLNFDLHRAAGLWLWPLLFIFAWSSVMLLDVGNVYGWTTARIFDYENPGDDYKPLAHPDESPKLNWHEALQQSQIIMDSVAKQQHFTIGKAVGFAYLPEIGVYSYDVESSRNISGSGWGGAGIWLDGNTGELRKVWMPNGEHSGNTVSNWLRALHFADIHDCFVYRIFVFMLGIVICLLSVTGVILWRKKQQARVHPSSHR